MINPKGLVLFLAVCVFVIVTGANTGVHAHI